MEAFSVPQVDFPLPFVRSLGERGREEQTHQSILIKPIDERNYFRAFGFHRKIQ
jgi:hypothetical protein